MCLYATSFGGFVLHCVLLDVFQFSLELFKVLVHFLYVFRQFGKLPFEFPCPSLVLGDLLQQSPDPPAELPNRLGRRSESGCRGCGRGRGWWNNGPKGLTIRRWFAATWSSSGKVGRSVPDSPGTCDGGRDCRPGQGTADRQPIGRFLKETTFDSRVACVLLSLPVPLLHPLLHVLPHLRPKLPDCRNQCGQHS